MTNGGPQVSATPAPRRAPRRSADHAKPPVRTAADNECFGRYHEIRAAAQDLQGGLSSAVQAADGKDATARAAALTKGQGDLAILRKKFEDHTRDGLAAFEVVFKQDPSCRAWSGDAVVQIDGCSALVGGAWPAVGQTPDDIIVAYRKMIDWLDQVIYLCESNAMSPRINDILENMRVGQTMNLESTIGDDFPLAPALRAKLVKEMSDQDGVMAKGYLDSATGLIYRVDWPRYRQRRSAYRLLFAILLGYGLAVLACLYPLDDGWPFKPAMWLPLTGRYALVFLGASLHFLLQALTLSRKNGLPIASPWGDWLPWLNAHEMTVLKGIVSLVVVFFGVSFVLKGDVALLTALFAGYSCDSLVDQFLDRFDQIASAQAKRVSNALPKAAPPTSPTAPV
jgi:hypothetical protein